MTNASTGLLLAAALLWAGPARAASHARPNVVILDICSASADHIGFNGYSKPTTPALDTLAKQAAVFDRALSQSSWCLPNYASLFTGHTPEVHGQYINLPLRSLPDFETTLAEKLRDAGYRTGGFTGGVYFFPAWCLSRGFDHFTNHFSTSTALPAAFSKLTPEMLSWIASDHTRPFFIYATVDDLHVPYQSLSPERFDPGYDGVVHSSGVLNVRFFRAYNGEPLSPDDPMTARLKEFRSDPRALEHMSAHYDAALAQADASIARFIERLRALGVWDDTVLIVTGDHGELLGEHNLLGHTESLYEPVLRVPLLIRDPRLPQSAGRRYKELVERIDITPTVFEEAGAPYAGLELQGRSLLPVLRGEAPSWRKYAFASSKRNMAAPSDLTLDERVVTDGRWKLHAYLYKDRYELYDLAADPGERRDLSVEHPEVLARLSFELLKNMELSRPHAPGLPSGRELLRSPELTPGPHEH